MKLLYIYQNLPSEQESRNSCQATHTYLSWNLAAFPVFVSSFFPRKSKEKLLPVLQKTRGAVQGFWG